MSNLSSSTRALLDAAKHDGPSREKRAAIWTGVTGGLVTPTPLKIQPQTAASSGAAAGAAKSAFWAGASMKGAFIGALFGSAISIGVATFMLRAKTEPAHVAQAPIAAPVVAMTPAANAQAANAQAANVQSGSAVSSTPSIELSDRSDAKSTGNSGNSSSASNSAGTAKSSHATHAAKKESSTSIDLPDDLFARESAFVFEARRQLSADDPAAALKSVRAARSLEARQMEPEEMAIEAKALHALGRDKEAERVESLLRSMYPGR